jgi:hypothetical protein
MGTALLIQAFKDRDPACAQYSWALLYLKVRIYDIHSRMLSEQGEFGCSFYFVV